MTQVGLKNEFYLSQVSEPASLVTWSLSSPLPSALASSLAGQRRWSYLLQGEGEVPTSSQRELLFEFPQAAVRWKNSPSVFARSAESSRDLQITLGRALRDWSLLDSEWKLGIVEPRYRGDELSTLRVGLLGFFADAEILKFRNSVFLSPLYIPERGVPFSLNQGTLHSKSPWFLPVPSQVQVLNQGTPILYDAKLPPAQDLIRHGSVGFRSSRDVGRFSSVGFFWLNKPVAQLALSYDAVLSLSDLNAEVDLYPRVLRHQVMGFDWNWTWKSRKLWFGHFYDRPYETSNPIRGATVQKFNKAQVSGVGYSENMNSLLFKELSLKFGISYLHVQKTRDYDENSLLGDDGESLFPDRYWMKNALQTHLEFKLRKSWHIDFQFMRDLKFASSLLRSSLAYSGYRDWIFRMRSDVLGSTSSESFLSPFRRNDRLSGELQYVF